MENMSFTLGKNTHIIGKNGSGKTHILDAIHLATSAKNIYGNTKLEPNNRIELFFGQNFGKMSFAFASDDKREIFFVQSKKISKSKYLQELPFRTVYVSPFDMNILYFSPAMRREYLDDILSRAYAQFPIVKRDYEQIMRQRNSLLKKIREQEARPSDLDFWDTKFAEIAFRYGLYRKKYIEYVMQNMTNFPDFFGKYNVRIRYEGDWIFSDNSTQYIIEYLSKNRERDIFSGHTHIGPHRDDFVLEMSYQDNYQSVQFFLSR